MGGWGSRVSVSKRATTKKATSDSCVNLDYLLHKDVCCVLLEPPITIAGWCSLLGAPFVSELGQGWAPTWADSQSFWGRVWCAVQSPLRSMGQLQRHQTIYFMNWKLKSNYKLNVHWLLNSQETQGYMKCAIAFHKGCRSSCNFYHTVCLTSTSVPGW